MSQRTIQTNLKLKVEEFRSGLKQLIENLPDNPRKRIGSNCFTPSIRDTFQMLKTGKYKNGKEKRELISNWCPEFHDFKRQYQRIAQIISRTTFESLTSVLDEIIREERWSYPSDHGHGYTFYFHPEVIKNLKALWEKTNE